jgi:hypothetical protein
MVARSRAVHVSHQASNRRTSRIPHVLFVAALAAWALIEVLAGLNSFIHPAGHFGFNFRPAGASEAIVTNVEPSSAAADAGLRAGDRIEWQKMDSSDRYRLESPFAYKYAGMSLPLSVVRDGEARTIAMTAKPSPGVPSDLVAEALAIVVTLIFVGIAAALVLMRPTIVTWSFLLFASGYSIVQFGSLHGMLLPPWTGIHAASTSIALAAAVWGGGMFLSRFPDGTQASVGRWYDLFLAAAAVTLGVLFYELFGDYAARNTALGKIYLSLMIVTMAVSIALMLVRYQQGGPERARGRWVMLGSAVSLGALILDFALRLKQVPNFNNSPLDLTLSTALVLIPISVAYAILRHRVIDVNFVISRALIYGAMTSALVIMFSLVEFFIGKKLAAGGVAAFIEVAGALTVGFWFNFIHARVERFFESIFFQAQHRAEQHLARVAAAIPHAAAAATVDGFVTAEPATAYRLTSAALFRNNGRKEFVRVAAVGWPSEATETLLESDPLVAFLSAKRETLDLEDVGWTAPGMPTGNARPVVAAPIGVRDRLKAITLYGAHQSGEALDPDERRMLLDLANAASSAYDHLEAEALREEVAALRMQLGPPQASSS